MNNEKIELLLDNISHYQKLVLYMLLTLDGYEGLSNYIKKVYSDENVDQEKLKKLEFVYNFVERK